MKDLSTIIANTWAEIRKPDPICDEHSVMLLLVLSDLRNNPAAARRCGLAEALSFSEKRDVADAELPTLIDRVYRLLESCPDIESGDKQWLADLMLAWELPAGFSPDEMATWRTNSHNASMNAVMAA